MLCWSGRLRPDGEGPVPWALGSHWSFIVREWGDCFLVGSSLLLNRRWESLWAGTPALAVAWLQCGDSGSGENLVKEGGGCGESPGLVSWTGWAVLATAGGGEVRS